MTQQEAQFEDMMRKLRIEFVSGQEAGAPRIDYYLPEMGLLVELKTWETERLLSQLGSVTGRAVMVLVGPDAVKTLAHGIAAILEKHPDRVRMNQQAGV